jgi:hypothetical protein
MKAIVTVVVVVIVCLLLVIAANFVGQFFDLGYTLKNAPRVISDYMVAAMTDYRFWTVIIIVGVGTAIALVNGVPTIKPR